MIAKLDANDLVFSRTFLQGVYDQPGVLDTILTCANKEQTFEDVLGSKKLSGQNNHRKNIGIRDSKSRTDIVKSPRQNIYFSRVNKIQQKILGDHRTILKSEDIQLSM